MTEAKTTETQRQRIQLCHQHDLLLRRGEISVPERTNTNANAELLRGAADGMERIAREFTVIEDKLATIAVGFRLTLLEPNLSRRKKQS